MDTTQNQQTIAGPAAVEGFGYWSGRDVRVEFRPAPPNTGIIFVRSDLEGHPRIPARIENLTDTPLRTTLQVGEAGVGMVEHIMAALGGLEIDNCEIWINEPEMPGCDGSSLPFVEAIDAVGIVQQDAPQYKLVVGDIIDDVLRLGNERRWIEVRPSAGKDTLLKYHLQYSSTQPIGRQTLEISLTPDAFRKELAPCRTFVLRQEAERLLANGLGQRASFKDLLVFGDEGPIDNTLRFPDECVRHKLLDIVGDLALVGGRLVGSLTAFRSGHHLNARLVGALMGKRRVARNWKRCA